MALYQIAVLGNPNNEQISELEIQTQKMLGYFGLALHKDVEWLIQPPADFVVKSKEHTTVVFYGATGKTDSKIVLLHEQGIRIIPVASTLKNVPHEIPEQIRTLNCLAYDQRGTTRIVTALLENIGLLPKKKRVFISYRRDEAREVVLQLFDSLSANEFTVFLDTHTIPAAEDFQTALWHNLHDTDVLIMLHTKGYFESHFAKEEFQRAYDKAIPILRIGWPGSMESLQDARILDHVDSVELLEDDLDTKCRPLPKARIREICAKMEVLRCQGYALRSKTLLNRLRPIETSDWLFSSSASFPSLALITLPNGVKLAVYPIIGAPSAITLHEAARASAPPHIPAVLYDHIGLHPNLQEHLDWLDTEISNVRLLKANDVFVQLRPVGDLSL